MCTRNSVMIASTINFADEASSQPRDYLLYMYLCNSKDQGSKETNATRPFTSSIRSRVWGHGDGTLDGTKGRFTTILHREPPALWL